MPITLTVNGHARSVDVEPDTPLLWVLRDTLGLTGTKFGCGISACGVCTVHLNGRAVRTCTLPASAAEGAEITTIEGLAADGTLHRVQQAWIDHQEQRDLSAEQHEPAAEYVESWGVEDARDGGA